MEVLQANLQLDSTVEPVIAQPEITEAGESDRTVEVDPQTILAIMEEAPAQIEEDRPVLAEVRQLLSSLYLLLNHKGRHLFEPVHTEPLDTELVSTEESSMVVESEPDALHMDTSISVVPTPTIAVASQVPEFQEDRLDNSYTRS
jgi:hypothetical protein